MQLPAEKVYFPLEKPLYEVAPQLKSFGSDLGGGDWDTRLFHVNERYAEYRRNKLDCLAENPDKYLGRDRLPAELETKTAFFIFSRLQADYPDFFDWREEAGQWVFVNRITDETIKCTEAGALLTESLPVGNLLDAAVLQISEDIALTSRSADKTSDWLSYINVCAASHWDPREKLGQSFVDVHAPVANNEKLIRAATGLVSAMIDKGPYVRFIWSFVTDKRLNHHPVAPSGWAAAGWRGRSFAADSENPFYLRVERQTTTGFAADDFSLFTIGVAFLPATAVKANPVWRDNLTGAIESMNEAARKYKGVAHCYDELLQYLRP